MAIDFNTDPYFDDFSESQNFYRILFKPGRAVQARELTQIQSMLQNQIAQMGTNIFKDGTLIKGGETTYTPATYIWVTGSSNVSGFENTTIIGNTSGARARVRKTSYVTSTYPSALYVSMISGTFEPGETITIDGTITTATIASFTNSVGGIWLFGINSSVFFIKNHFVYCPPQTIVVGSTFSQSPSARVGLKITEGIATSDDNETLLDPALGASNYYATGADRYYIDLTLISIDYNPDVENSDAEIVNEFIEVSNVRRGENISKPLNTEYSGFEKLLARRTYDESGDYTVKPFIVKAIDNIYRENSLATLEISAGKAYVKGYEFETTGPTYMTLERARDYSNVNGFSVSLDYGQYLPVANINGFFNASTFDQVTIHRVNAGAVSVASNIAYSNTTIGTARIRHIQATGTANVYNFYLANIAINSSNTFSEANSFLIANTTTSTKIAVANVYPQGNAQLTYGTDDSFIFYLPQRNIKTLKPNGTSDTVLEAYRNFSSVSFVPGTGGYSGNSVATITLTGNDVFVGSAGVQSDTFLKERFFAVVTSSSGSPAVGTILNFTGSSGEIEYDGGKQNAYLRFVNGNNFSANVVALVSSSQAQSKQKTVAIGTKVVSFGSDANVISLGKSDVFRILSIVDALGNSYLNSYTFDNGQRDDMYDHGKLTIKNANLHPTLSVTNSNVTVTFNYFQHSGTTYFDVDSYTSTGVEYGSIPSYTTSKGITYRLSDVVDFRPVRVDDATSFNNSSVPPPGGSLVADYQYYLPRKDRLVLTKDKRFAIIQGTSSDDPSLPSNHPDAMNLYDIDIPAYTISASDIKLKYIDNKRFTMQDIGKIDRRVNRLEYFTVLNFLEKQAADEKVPSTVTGIDRFKNGILVDPFSGHSVADVRNGDFSASIDKGERTLRPRCTTPENIEFKLNTGSSNNYAATSVFSNKIITSSYTTTGTEIKQLKATNSVNLNPFEVFTWTGIISLNPATDIWGDTSQLPDVVVNQNGENDAFSVVTVGDSPPGKAYTQVWDNWRQVFKGVTDVDVTSKTYLTGTRTFTGNNLTDVNFQASTYNTVALTVKEAQARAGLQVTSEAKTLSTRLGNKVIDSSLIPFIRRRNIEFAGKSFKPNTTLLASFDGVDVTNYCTPATIIKLACASITSNITKAEVYQSSTLLASSNVIIQNGNVLHVVRLSQTNPFYVSNTATLTSSSGTFTSNIISVSESNQLVTDSVGSIAGVFSIPDKFNVGERAFKLTDSLDPRFATTAGETKYLAYGLSNTRQETVLATRMNLVNLKPIFDVKSDTTSVIDTPTIPPDIDKIVDTKIQAPVTPVTPEYTNTVICGVKITGSAAAGVFMYKFVIKEGTTKFRIKVNTNNQIPVNMKSSYRGTDNTLGYIVRDLTGSGYNWSGLTDSIKSAGFNDYKVKIVLDSTDVDYTWQEITVPSGITGDHFGTIEVIAPLAGCMWSFIVECDTAAGTNQGNTPVTPVGVDPVTIPNSTILKVYAEDSALNFVNADRYNNRGIVEQSGEAHISTQLVFEVVPAPGVPLNQVKSVRINSVSLVYPENIVSGYYVDVLTGTTVSESFPTFSIVYSGTSYANYYEGISKFPGKPKLNRSETWTPSGSLSGGWTTNIRNNNFTGSAPWILNSAGQTGIKALSVTINKSEKSKIDGSLKITIDATDTSGTEIPIQFINFNRSLDNSGFINCKTSLLAPGNTWIDPVAQSFRVDPLVYPRGMFLSSIDLWFRTKDSSIPVTLALRPLVNGVPSSKGTDVIPFSVVVKEAKDIVANTTFAESRYTRFTFEAPVFLPPGEFAFILLTNTKEYTLFTAVLGEFQLDQPAVRVTSQPYLGSLFKSQNASTWTPEQTEDLTFRINQCVFSTDPVEVVLDVKAPTSNVLYDVLHVDGDIVEFAETTLNTSFKSTSEATRTLDSSFTPYSLGTNYPLSETKAVVEDSDQSFKFKFQMRTSNPAISPVIDLDRLSATMIGNIINNDATNEDSVAGGNALAKYVTRRVTLNPGFEAQSLRVYLYAYLPGSSSIQVYYKVNAPGTSDFDTQNEYQLMTEVSEVGDSRAGYAEFVFEPSNANGYCLSDGALFNTFTVKIVMLSSDTTTVPQIKDLRVLALDVE